VKAKGCEQNGNKHLSEINLLLGSSVSIVTRLQAGRPVLDSRHGNKFLSLLHRFQTDSGAHPLSHLIDTEGTFPGDKAAGV
jgi:hypothetical protein